MNVDLGPKLLEMLRGMAPTVTRVAVLVNSANAYTIAMLKIIQASAQKVGIAILPIDASTPQEIVNGFAAMAREKAGALIVPQEPFFNQQRNQVVELAAKHRLPSISG